MRHYELVFVLKPTLSEEELSSKVDAVKSLIQQNGGEIVELQKWGRKNLAYPIQSFNSGYYYLITYTCENSGLPSVLEYNLRIDESVIRFLNIKLKKNKVSQKKTA